MPIADMDIHTNTPALTIKTLAYPSVREGGGFEKDGDFLLPADLDFITGCQDHLVGFKPMVLSASNE